MPSFASVPTNLCSLYGVVKHRTGLSQIALQSAVGISRHQAGCRGHWPHSERLCHVSITLREVEGTATTVFVLAEHRTKRDGVCRQAGRPVGRSVRLCPADTTTASRTIKQRPHLKGKVALVQARRAYREKGGVTPLFLNLRTTCRSEVNFTPGPLTLTHPHKWLNCEVTAVICFIHKGVWGEHTYSATHS
jgi:hypothetical protein